MGTAVEQELEELTQFVYLAPVGIIRFRPDGAIDMINPAAAQLLLPLAAGGALTSIYPTLERIAPDVAERIAAHTEDAGPILVHRRHAMRTPDGRTQALSLSVHRISRSALMATIEDVTRIVEQERKLFEDRQQLGAILDHVRDYAIYTVGIDGRIDEWNHSLRRFGGWQARDLVGQSFGTFFPPGDRQRAEELLSRASAQGSVENETWYLRKDGTRVWANSVITALPDPSGQVRGFVVVTRDMTERKRMEDELRRLATTDPLTGAYNRRFGHTRLAEELRRRERYQNRISVLLLDIDHFKAINDRFGHEAGDEVLRRLVDICVRVLRSVDIVVRWGGEEFLVLLPETGRLAAGRAAERIRAAVAAAEIAVEGSPPIAMTVSIGAAEAIGSDPGDVVRRADVALYAAKNGGRNRTVVAEGGR
ncbi:diguanylate cyclase [Stella sp.]|uniref:sensor domain-containing diguanylate cyclase n=1 Tax=Stella sp. TaxID=2912054 RepID=UPI0035AE23D7